MNPRHFLRMAKWARKPPSWTRVKLFFAVAVFCLGLLAVERWIGWPEALTPNNTPKGRIFR